MQTEEHESAVCNSIALTLVFFELFPFSPDLATSDIDDSPLYTKDDMLCYLLNNINLQFGFDSGRYL